MKNKKWKNIVVALLSLVILFQVTAAAALAPAEGVAELHGMGCIPPTQEQLDKIPTFTRADSKTALPTLVDLTSKFPTPGDQGQQNCCTAWATAYAAKTYQEQVRRNWGQNTASHQFSPSFIYNLTNEGRDEGAYTSAAINTIISYGVCSLADMPYNKDDYQTKPNAQQMAKAANYKAAKLSQITGGNVNNMKFLLSHGIAVILDAVPIYPDFDKISPENSTFDEVYGTSRGYHTVCLIGYDDQKGSFKFINSWGTDWGIGGYGYISYNIVKNHKLAAYIMFEDYMNNTVIYNANGGTGTMSPSYSPGGEGIPLSKNKFERTGYHFTGWSIYRQSDSMWYYLRPNGRNLWYTEADKPSDAVKAVFADQSTLFENHYVYGEDYTVYAQWEKDTYTVKYDPNGGTGSMADTTVIWGTKTPLRDLAFTNIGSTFIGWYAHRQSDNMWYYTNSTGVQGWYAEGSQPSGYYKALFANKNLVSKSTNVHNDVVTMYAQWRKHTYTVKYDPNGGTGSMADTHETYGTGNLRPNTFTRDGYLFKGWYLQKGTTWHYTPGWFEEGNEPLGSQKTLFRDTQAIGKITSEDKAVITAHAQWEKISLCYGDVDGDGIINVSDIFLLQHYLSLMVNLNDEQLKRADVNADGVVNTMDVLCIQKYIAKEEHNSRTGTPVV